MSDATTEQDDVTAIHIDQFLAHPPAKVWRALTEPTLQAEWLPTTGFRLDVGTRFTIAGRPVPATNFSGTVACEVEAVEPGRLLRVSWADAAVPDQVPMHVTWTLVPEGNGTRLLLDQTGFAPDDPIAQLSRQIMDGGWRGMVLRRFAEILDGATVS